MSAHSENARQWVHIGSGAFALLLRFLSWPQAAGLALMAFVFNAFALPRVGGRRLYRPSDAARGFPLGILLYPLSVLALVLTFRSRLDCVAAAWGVLAFGDGFATLVGQRVTTSHAETRGHADQGSSAVSRRSAWDRRLPWNPDKSVAGTTAFVVFGGLAAIALASWTSGRPVVAAPLVAAVAAAFVESIPVTLDDNLSVPFAAGAVLWLANLMNLAAWSTALPWIVKTLPSAIGVNIVVGWIGYRAKTVTLSGFAAGVLVGIVIFAGGGANAWLLLFLTFAMATAASRLGLRRKMTLGIAEDRGGRRGAGNAFANCGVAAIAGALAVTTNYPIESLLALTAALVAGGSDTVASEIGKAWGRRTFLVSTLRRVAPGTPGAMSVEGTLAGLAAAIVLGSAAVLLGLIGSSLLFAVVVGATVGALVESLLGATLEGPGILNNDMLNFINTAVAAVVALAFA